MRDFCNVSDRDCVRLIVAQDLRESGIDIDSSTNMLGGGGGVGVGGARSCMSSSAQHNMSHQHASTTSSSSKSNNISLFHTLGHHHNHNHTHTQMLASNQNILNTSHSAAHSSSSYGSSLFHSSSSNKHHHHTTNNNNSNSNNMSQHHHNKSANITSSIENFCSASNNNNNITNNNNNKTNSGETTAGVDGHTHQSMCSFGGRLFGASLGQLELAAVTIDSEGVEVSSATGVASSPATSGDCITHLTVPVFLKHAIAYIGDFMHVEGLFRRNGTASRLKELKRQADEGLFNFSSFAVFDLTSLIKLFFREMPDSLLTTALYSSFIQAVKLAESKAKLDSILNLCLQLPDLNLHTLIYLMHFLRRVAQHDELNKMNSFNLAVCFAPNIIYTRHLSATDLYINEERCVVQLLIDNSPLIGKISDSVYERYAFTRIASFDHVKHLN